MNTIFKYIGPDLTSEEQTNLSKSNISYVQIPEMKDGYYQADVNYPEQFETIKTFLESKGVVSIVGIWNSETGLQYGYIYDIDDIIIRDDNVISYPFSIEKYRDGLRSYQERDIDGNILVDRIYTLEEARNKQVNKFAGRYDRNLD